jgi:modulator of FtsH protease
MAGWSDFFLGELGAAAALAGLLFVSLSVNQSRILELGRTADRGLEALAMLFLVLVVTSLPLIPGQPPRLLGAEILGVAAASLLALVPVQIGYVRSLEAVHRRRSMIQVWMNRAALSATALGGLVLAWRGDQVGLYILPVGILMTFVAVAASAWVLLIEINR